MRRGGGGEGTSKKVRVEWTKGKAMTRVRVAGRVKICADGKN